MKWIASAPANIALIKYMGKVADAANLPVNASLSYTLEKLRTYVELELVASALQDQWQPLNITQAPMIPALNQAAQQRYINHLNGIKRYFNITRSFIIRSANNFPAGCGIASSASSFAALTLCAVNACAELAQAKPLTIDEIAALSRAGSGSSCRSLLKHWVLWEGEKVQQLELPYPSLQHRVVVVSNDMKAISSSAAHQRVASSLLYQTRPERAHQRLNDLLQAFKQQNWRLAFAIVWQEFWDMHALFETCDQPFGYIQPATLQVLDYLRTYWENVGDGPLVTLDAGPNVHLLFRDDQLNHMEVIKKDLAKSFAIL